MTSKPDINAGNAQGTRQMERLRSVTLTLLDSQIPAHSMRPEVVEMTTVLSDSQSVWSASQEDISRGETRTSNGLAISPTMAAMCSDDYVRTIEFIRGTHAAIVDIRKQFPDRPARILYVGCGPFAILAVPLMAIFSSPEVTFTLLDIHPESIESAKSIIGTLGLSKSVACFETMDAGLYSVCPDQPPDIILIEIMQACLESEPQVAITRHLLEQAPNAIVVPEEVRIELTLVDPSREFDVTALEQNRDPVQRERISVGPVFVVNRETIRTWDHNCDDRLPAHSVQIPDPLEQRFFPMLFSVIRTYKNHILMDYDSGLTAPRAASITGTLKPGDTIQFSYELGRHPRLIGEVCARSRQDGVTSRSAMPEGPTQMIDRVKLDLSFDPQLLQKDLEKLKSSEWTDHFVKQNYDGDWSVIALRGPADATHPIMMIYSNPACTEFADTPFLENTPYFRKVLKSFSCPLQAVRLMKLSPGSRIKEHTDHDLAAENGTARLHIPIVTNEKVDFRINGTRVVLNEGECWYLRLCDPHSVENNGQSDRVHLVIDAEVNPWLMTQLNNPGRH